MSNLAIINDALSLIGVVSEGQDASAEQGEHALRSLNDMLAAWDVDIGYFPQVSTAEDFPCDAKYSEAVKYALAVRLAPHYQRPASGELVAIAATSYGRLLRDKLIDSLYAADPVLPVPEGRRWYGTEE
jgi:hypothetical protein